MGRFALKELARLASCHSDLRRVCFAVREHIHCTVLAGHRGEDAQNEAHKKGRSQRSWPYSVHNKRPSLAVDIVPANIDWKDRERMSLFAGFMIATAASLRIGLRWGGDWDGDFEVNDNGFDDLAHFELIEGTDACH